MQAKLTSGSFLNCSLFIEEGSLLNPEVTCQLVWLASLLRDLPSAGSVLGFQVAAIHALY